MRRKIDIALLIIVVIAGGFLAKNAQAVGDWWHAQHYKPSAEITKLADDAGMSPTGRQLFYRFEPQIVDQQTLTEACSVEKLGCTEGRSIYILQSTNDSEYDRGVVTAAHEMLHVAYSRLDDQTINDLKPLIDAALQKPEAADIVDSLKTYDSADYYNEAHSFIGSQLPDLSPELENHYAKYFSDRAKTTQAYSVSPEQ